MNPRAMRRTFIRGLFTGLRVVWPVLSALLTAMIVLGLVIGLIEGWSAHESLYFALITGLSIGYGDFVPHTLATRTLAIVIGICGVLVVALLAAVAVKAMSTERIGGDRNDDGHEQNQADRRQR